MVEHEDHHQQQQCGNPRCYSSKRKNLWLITFGDLLTLLLCFFLSLISFGALDSRDGKVQELVSTEKNTLNEIVERKSAAGEISGTRIALSPVESESHDVVRIHFTESDYEQFGMELSSKGIERLRKEVEPMTYQAEAIEIESCSQRPGSTEAQSWFRSVGRALALRSQLLDAGIDANSIGIRSIGQHCDVLSDQQEGGEAVALLSFRYVGELNG